LILEKNEIELEKFGWTPYRSGIRRWGGNRSEQTFIKVSRVWRGWVVITHYLEGEGLRIYGTIIAKLGWLRVVDSLEFLNVLGDYMKSLAAFNRKHCEIIQPKI